MVDIKKLFYEHFVLEAAKGKVNAFLNYSIAFSTRIVDENKICKCIVDNENVLLPTLLIKNKEEFDRLLTEYVDKSLKFYDDANFLNEILDYKQYDEKNMVCKEKVIMIHLFANATMEDFNNPVNFLKKRIDFIDNAMTVKEDLGYSNMLDSNLELCIARDTINNETPNEFIVTASEHDYNFVFPRVKFGISDNTVYIYAIQNDRNMAINPLSKKINRKLYKIGEGFTPTDIEENPKDITASFLVVLNMAINYFKSLGYTRFIVPSILIVRWNSKMIINDFKYKKGKFNDNEYHNANTNQEIIQNNLTNKLIRTFIRLGYHYNDVEFVSLPYEVDSYLHMRINDTKEEICNNSLLFETGKMASVGNTRQIKR